MPGYGCRNPARTPVAQSFSSAKLGTGNWNWELTRAILSIVADTHPVRHTLSPESRIVLSKDQASCDLAGETAIVNLKSGVYYGLDPMGTHVWKLLAEPMTLRALCDSLEHDYDVDGCRLEFDMREFLSVLADHGLIDIS